LIQCKLLRGNENLAVSAKLLAYINRNPFTYNSLCNQFKPEMRVDSLKDNLSYRNDKDRKTLKRAYHVVDDFMSLALIFYNSLGIEPYESDQKRGFWF